MNSGEQYINLGSERLHYRQTGGGSRVVLAFHGYGEEAEVFNPIAQHLTAAFTVLSFDLPHHGKSSWGGGAMTKAQLKQLVETVLQKYRVQQVSLLGYSMGGRVCLTAVELMPELIERVVLLSPDGLADNAYYSFFARTVTGRKIFRHVLENPKPYLGLMNWAHRMKLVHPSRYKFAMNYVSTPEQRSHLVNVWPAMSELVPMQAKLKRSIRDNRIPVALYMGASDRVMPPKLGMKFAAGLDTVQLHILDRGHRVFDEENAADIASSFLL